jgi:hypothetical protein
MPKYDAFWRRMEEPLDWALIAAERAGGKRHSLKTNRKISAARKRIVKAKRKARAIELALLKPPKRKKGPGSVNALSVMLGVMEPGKWYGRSDMQHLSGLKRGTIASTIIHAESLGRLIRTKNPAWERQGGVECEFLYRIVEVEAV